MGLKSQLSSPPMYSIKLIFILSITVTEMLLAILSICSREELAESDSDDETHGTEDLAARRQLIKSKILAVGRMQKVFQLLRYDSDFTDISGDR